MYRTTHPPLRYTAALRRARRVAVAGAAVLIPAACGTGDADVFGDASAPTTVIGGADAANETSDATTVAPVAESSTTPTDATTSDTTTGTTTGTTATTAADAAADESSGSGAIPTSSELVVSFTYTATDEGGRVHNPYLAVWIEDTDGRLVQTVALWYLQDAEGGRWLDDLRNWYDASDGEVITSGATRPTGDYAVVWDGTGLDGLPVASGDYLLFVESAREHGPHSITSAAITLGDEGFTVELPADAELAGVSATMTV